MPDKILVINPGSTSTKLALFDTGGSMVFDLCLEHSPQELAGFKKAKDQHSFRKKIILDTLAEKNIALSGIKYIVGRGGLMKPVESGTYRVNEKMIEDLENESLWGKEHASNLGCIIARELAQEINAEAFTVDPVTVNELEPVAKISGVPEIERKCLVHALNIRAVALKYCTAAKKRIEDVNLVVVHLGGGISVCAFTRGKMVDVNNALLGMGPFSPQRAGALPIGDLVEMSFSGKYTKGELLKKLSRSSGLTGYLGTDKVPEIVERINKGDKQSELVLDALAYQVSKKIGAMSTALEGKPDAIILTGGMSQSGYVVERIKKRVSFIAEVLVSPSQDEMKALCDGVIRVITGKEKEKTYE